jgi:hypothetical protein
MAEFNIDKMAHSVAERAMEELKDSGVFVAWIPVSERLPEKRGMYIVTEKVFSLNDREHTGKFNRMTEQVEFCNGKWQRASIYEVIAWMPLPEPWKGESE